MNTLNNGYQGQLQYNSQIFPRGQDLFPIICSDSKFSPENCYLRRIGIMGHLGNVISLGKNENNKERVMIGKTGMYEIDNVAIKYLSFLFENPNEEKSNAEPKKITAIIDYILIEGE